MSADDAQRIRQASMDDSICVPRGTVDHIGSVGDQLSLRLAGAMPPATHYVSACKPCGYSDDGPREPGV